MGLLGRYLIHAADDLFLHTVDVHALFLRLTHLEVSYFRHEQITDDLYGLND